MIHMIEAVKHTKRYAEDLYQNEELKNLSLEEILLDEESQEWLVTLSFDSYKVKKLKSKPIEVMHRLVDEQGIEELALYSKGLKLKETLREYKTFIIDANEGLFLGMLMRDSD